MWCQHDTQRGSRINKEREKERRLVGWFQTEHNDDINELLSVIDFIKDEGEMKKNYPEHYEFGLGRLGMRFNNGFVLNEYDYPRKGCGYSQLDYFRNVIISYQGLDEEVEKYVEQVKSFIGKPLDELEIDDVREIRKKLVKFPPKLEVSVFYKLTGRLSHEELDFKERYMIIHFYNTFVGKSEELLRKSVRYRFNVLYHLLRKIGKEPKANSFTFMKGSGYKRT